MIAFAVAKIFRNTILTLAAAALCIAIPIAGSALILIHAVAVKYAIVVAVSVLAVAGSALAIKELQRLVNTKKTQEICNYPPDKNNNSR